MTGVVLLLYVEMLAACSRRIVAAVSRLEALIEAST